MSGPSPPRTPGEMLRIPEDPEIEAEEVTHTTREQSDEASQEHEQGREQADHGHLDGEPTPASRSGRPARYRLERRRSGPATLQSRIERTRNVAPSHPTIRAGRSYEDTRQRSNSNSTSRSSEQPINRRAIHAAVAQPSGSSRQCRLISHNGQYDMRNVLSVENMNKQAAQMRQFDGDIPGPSHRHRSYMTANNHSNSDRATAPRSVSTISETGYAPSSTGSNGKLRFHDPGERDQQRIFAQHLSTQPPRNPHHGRNPAFIGRPALRDTYPVAPPESEFGEDVALEARNGSHHDSRAGSYRGSHDGSQNGSQHGSQHGSQTSSDGLYRQISQSNSFSRQRTRHSSEMGQWLQSSQPAIPAHYCPSQPQQPSRSFSQQQPRPSRTYAPQQHQQQPSPSYSHRPRPSSSPRPREPLNPNPAPRQKSPLARRLSNHLPTTNTPGSKPNWWTRFYRHFLRQLRGAAPDIRGDPFQLQLEDNIAPVHWLLRTVQFALWTAIFGVFMWQSWISHRMLAFDCAELKTQLRGDNPQANLTATGRVEEHIVSKVIIPDDFLVTHGFQNGKLCFLTPVIPETALFDNFRARWIVGIMCVGFANLVEVVLFMCVGKTMRKSGAYGNWTLVIRASTGLCAAMVGSAAVMKWAGLVLGFSGS